MLKSSFVNCLKAILVTICVGKINEPDSYFKTIRAKVPGLAMWEFNK